MSATEASPSPSSRDGILVKVIAATVATTLLVAGIIFYFVYKYAMARERQKNKLASSFRREAAVDHQEFTPQDRALKNLVVVDNCKDVLCLQKLEGGQLGCFSTIWFNPLEEEDKRLDGRGEKPNMFEPIQEVPLLHDTSNIIHYTEVDYRGPSLPQHSQPSAKLPCPVILDKQTPPPPPPPPPPPSQPIKKFSRPPPPLNPTALVSSLKPPTASRGKVNSNSREEASTEQSSKGNEVQLKLKPLHWDKVTTNVDHSLVWNEINGGSFRFSDELIEALFGYDASATNNKSPEIKNNSSISGSSGSAPPPQIFILDPRRSQNTAIVLKSLAISHKEIQDALLEGRGLNADTLEKLTKISPTQEEEAKILQFNGNPTKLAVAESFLYQLLQYVPSAFSRINAMLFRANYDPDILHLKESLQTLEFGCKELRARGIFLKLLEAILKAGNRMNAGTDRGNAQGFNLSALRKLSHVKSTDGKTTLLQFVVEQVVRAEGKRCAINSNQGPGRIKDSKNTDQDSDCLTDKEDRDNEYLMLGLPVLGSLSTEFSNVKKAATIDPDTFMNECPNLILRVIEIRQIVTQCGNDERGEFVREMKGFIEECEEELKVVREEQTRVMQLVKRTTEFYQAGASMDKAAHPLQIFIFVKDFLDMVDQASTEITKKLQKKNLKAVESSPLLSPSTRAFVMFQSLQSYFMPVKPGSTSFSESVDDF